MLGRGNWWWPGTNTNYSYSSIFNRFSTDKSPTYTSQHQQIPTHLWEFVAHFFYLLPFLANDGSVKTLFNDQVLCTLVLLRETVYLVTAHQGPICSIFACELKFVLTMRDASSSSSFLASCTPWGSPSIRIRLLFSLSGGIRTVTLCSSLMRLTIKRIINNKKVNKCMFEKDADPVCVTLL